ncbi:hypothetical protein [Actinokineospora iranica]|uniref:Uncharacterized protein n=1 Tax=Actinokineospora iranica TaxID=1271860 RepID=A0A1G6QZQ8_9PSEU|nr:hypothetical protein SAMN05216174_10660 [Actinokineospora iranica]
MSAGTVVACATQRGLAVGEVVSEVGSGMNGHRRKLTRIRAARVVAAATADEVP